MFNIIENKVIILSCKVSFLYFRVETQLVSFFTYTQLFEIVLHLFVPIFHCCLPLSPPPGQRFSVGALYRAVRGRAAAQNDQEAEESQEEGSQVSSEH